MTSIQTDYNWLLSFGYIRDIYIYIRVWVMIVIFRVGLGRIKCEESIGGAGCCLAIRWYLLVSDSFSGFLVLLHGVIRGCHLRSPMQTLCSSARFGPWKAFVMFSSCFLVPHTDAFHTFSYLPSGLWVLKHGWLWMEMFMGQSNIGGGSGFHSHRATPSHHPYFSVIFPFKNPPASYWGTPIPGDLSSSPPDRQVSGLQGTFPAINLRKKFSLVKCYQLQ